MGLRACPSALCSLLSWPRLPHLFLSLGLFPLVQTSCNRSYVTIKVEKHLLPIIVPFTHFPWEQNSQKSFNSQWSPLGRLFSCSLSNPHHLASIAATCQGYQAPPVVQSRGVLSHYLVEKEQHLLQGVVPSSHCSSLSCRASLPLDLPPSSLVALTCAPFLMFVCLFYFTPWIFSPPSPYPYLIISHVVSGFKYEFQTSISDCLLNIIWISNFISHLVPSKPASSGRIPIPVYSNSDFQLLRLKTFHGFNPLGS